MRILAVGLLALVALAQAATAQVLPSHTDPSAREELPDLSRVPAIRFLTSTGFPPFTYRDARGELVGYNIDLARAICAAIQAQCTIQTWPWDQVTNALADNQGDALIAGLAIDAETAQRFDFSNIYLMLPARFVSQRGSAFTAVSGGTVAVRAGSAHESYLRRFFPDLSLRLYPDEIGALTAIAAGDVEAFFGDAMRASFWLNDNPGCCGFASGAYFDTDFFGQGLAVALPAGLDNVRQAINWALSRLQRDGTMEELYLKWFPVGFY